ncbi:NACHT domain-containing protein [Nocardia sp. NPDC051750]|uniref:NACHT domain-containing protein n=1 Tax=Nocardia sp. NPDC051750 TaxID=3364325 RepID=UPI0037ADCCFF
MSGGEFAAAARSVPVAVSVVSKLWRWLYPDTSRTALTTHADDLADLVRRTESRRLEQLGVVPGAGIRVSFDALIRAHGVDRQEFGTLSEVGNYYRELGDPERFVVLGAAGAGKTVTALHLLLNILHHRDSYDGRPPPVPVRVNAASWDTTTRGFTDFLAGMLATDYHLAPKVARALVESDRILPVLDGLDEMDPIDEPPARARAALDQLNENPWRRRPVIVISRAATYAQARELRIGGDAGLHAATAVTLRPLTTPEIVEYLRRCRELEGIHEHQWSPVIDRLRAEPAGALAEALRTPWLLTLSTAHLRTHRRAGADELTGATDLESIREVLFAALIPAAVAGLSREDRKRRYDQPQVHRWLHNLARHCDRREMHDRHGSDIALDEVWRLAGNRCRLVHGLLAGLLLGTMFSITPVVAQSLPLDSIFGASLLGSPLLRGPLQFTAGFLVGFAAGLRPGTPARRTVSHLFGPGELRGWLVSLGIGLVAGTVCGISIGFVAGNALGPGRGFLAGLICTLGFGPVIAIVVRLASQLPHKRPILDERRAIRDDALVGISLASVIGVFLTLMFTLLYLVVVEASADSLIRLPPVGLTYILFAALFISPASMRYLCAKLIFALDSTFSRRPGPFLEWARDAGLLRVTGEAYQFRHQTYQQWLTTRPAPNTQ